MTKKPQTAVGRAYKEKAFVKNRQSAVSAATAAGGAVLTGFGLVTGNPLAAGAGIYIGGTGAKYAMELRQQARDVSTKGRALEATIKRSRGQDTGSLAGYNRANRSFNQSADAPVGSGAERTKPYTDSKGRNFANGRAITRKGGK